MSHELRRTGSPDEVHGDHDADRLPELPEQWPPCDSGRSADCTGIATVVHPVSYLPEPLKLCDTCLAWEQQQEADGPSDEQVMNTTGTNGWVSYDPDDEWQMKR